MALESDKKFSSEATQPIEAEGKNPNLFSGPNLDEPSLLTTAENKYFPL